MARKRNITTMSEMGAGLTEYTIEKLNEQKN